MQEKKKILLGIVQGRLSNSPKQILQFFPKNYKEEFPIAKKIGFDFLEYFSEEKFNKKNPIWKSNKKKNYLEMSHKYGLRQYIFCDNYIISNSLLKKKNLFYIKKLIKKLINLNIKNLILPLYGSSLMTDKNYVKYSDVINNILKYESRIKLFIESDISPETFKKLKILINSTRLKFLFDTGNRALLKRDLYNDIIKFNKDIGHVHIKDKNSYKKNVMLGNGLVDFSKIFKNLKKINYRSHFTLETTRGSSYFISAKKNYIFTKKLIFKFLLN